MDLATENRIASILLKEAAELRRQAEKEGALAYLRQPNVRGRPNSRFLTATVLGVQQANRSVEEGEMWRSRQKEIELDNRLKRRTSDDVDNRNPNESLKKTSKRSSRSEEVSVGPSSCLSRKRTNNEEEEDSHLREEEDEALKDDEVEDFLRSRVKRGRGAVGSRMDETGPYLPCGQTGSNKNQWLTSSSSMNQMERERKRIHLGPEKPSFIEGEGIRFSRDKSFIKKHKETKKKLDTKHKTKSKRDPKKEDIKIKKKKNKK